MKWNKLIIPVLLVVLGICSEYLPELFKTIYYDKVVDSTGYVYEVNYSDAVWYFNYSLFVLVMIIVILINMVKKSNLAGAVILSGLVFWFGVECYEKFCFLAKINNNRIFINDGSIWQLFTMLFVMFLAFFGYTKFKY